MLQQEKIGSLREAAGLTPGQLAEAAGVSSRTVRELESGERENPREVTLQRISRALASAATQLENGTPGIDLDEAELKVELHGKWTLEGTKLVPCQGEAVLQIHPANWS